MKFYLPEIHDFEYTAVVPWPTLTQQQQDWIAQVTHMTNWLNSSIGPHWVRWAWDQGDGCSVAFQRDPDRTLFVLRWSWYG